MKYLITGGEFNNKGAEGMTLVAINNILKSDPFAKIYLLSKNTNNPFTFKCDFEILDCSQYVLHKLANRRIGFERYIKEFLKLLIPGKESGFGKKFGIKKILESIDVMIDVSGYQLSSKWDNDTNIDYCCWINVMHSFGSRIYLMPQSFGPFDYNNGSIIKLIKSTLCKCTRIYARENSGFDLLKKIGLKNVEMCPDSVLIENDLNLEKIIKDFNCFVEDFKFKNTRNIAIIPNKRLIDKGGYKRDDLISFYREIILNYKDFDFYLISHAGEDLLLCKEIKDSFINDERVHFIDHVLYSFNYQQLTKKMDFIVASRYHSIIHAYKETTPSVILGWSDKYANVAKLFEQAKYIIADIADFEKALRTISLMASEYGNEKKVIHKHLLETQKNKCYSILGEENGNK